MFSKPVHHKIVSEYQKKLVRARDAAVIFCLLCVGIASAAGSSAEKEAQIVRSVLVQVEKCAAEQEELEEFGKKVLTQSSVILDLQESARPVLIRTARNPAKDWKVRYWSVDMLGYIGVSKTAVTLRKILLNEKEMVPVRARAADSLLELRTRSGKKKSAVWAELIQLKNEIPNIVLKKKLASVADTLKPAKPNPTKSTLKKKKKL